MGVLVRYPGRAALLGEHCDWAGGASLAVPLPLGIDVEAEPGSSGIRVRATPHGHLEEARFPRSGRVDPQGGPLRFVGAAAAVLTETGLLLPPTDLCITGDLPAGRGFSSSAAVTLAVLDALAQQAGAVLPAPRLAALAYTVERTRLGVPCGRFDPLACAAAAPVLLRWSDGHAPLCRVPLGRPVPLVVAALAAPRDTPRFLAALRDGLQGLRGSAPPPPVAEVLHGYGVAAEEGASALVRGDLASLGSLMNDAQRAYQILASRLPELHAPQIAAACSLLQEGGALGAKFSGAGGEGSVVAVFPTAPAASAAAERLRDQGLSAWSHVLEMP